MLETIFAQGILGNIQVPNLTPAAAINLVMVGVSLESIIFPPGDSLVCVAIAVSG